jgi:hypothetical protein
MDYFVLRYLLLLSQSGRGECDFEDNFVWHYGSHTHSLLTHYVRSSFWDLEISFKRNMGGEFLFP